MRDDSPTGWILNRLLLAKDAAKDVPYTYWALLSLVIITCYAVSRAIYHLYFHPLAKFPGPRWAAVSNTWYGYHWFRGRYPWAVEEALKQYGDAVRVAPNEVVFMTPQAYNDIYSNSASVQHSFVKTKFQDIGEKELGITAERDPTRHREVRKLLNPGFGARSMHEKEGVLHEHIDRFVEQLGKLGSGEKGLNIIDWCDWLAFDVAGDMGYGRQFNNVKDAKSTLFLSTFVRVGLWGTISQVMMRFPWIKPIIWFMLPPSVVITIPTLLKWNRREVRSRLERRNELSHPDYFGHLLTKGKEDPDEDWLLAQANVLIVAGFDPNTNVSSACFHFLTKNPDKLAKLARETREEFATYESINCDALVRLKYLQGTIDESLRIHTNAAFGLPRISPGATIDSQYVPKGCVVQTCFYATTHSPRYFAHPKEYHPERWLPHDHPEFEEVFKDDRKEAFTPFSQGPRGCPGAYASYMQARLLLAKVVWRFDMECLNRKEIDWDRDCRLYALWRRPDTIVRFTPVVRKG